MARVSHHPEAVGAFCSGKTDDRKAYFAHRLGDVINHWRDTLDLEEVSILTARVLQPLSRSPLHTVGRRLLCQSHQTGRHTSTCVGFSSETPLTTSHPPRFDHLSQVGRLRSTLDLAASYLKIHIGLLPQSWGLYKPTGSAQLSPEVGRIWVVTEKRTRM